MVQTIIEASNLTISYQQPWYRKKTVLEHISFHVTPGEIIALVGDNGAGKSTLLNALCGLISLDSGTLKIHTSIGYVPQQCSLPPFLTVYQVLAYNAALMHHQLPSKKYLFTIVDTLQLTEYAHRTIAECSKGIQQRVCIAQALVGNPGILILDEPCTGLDKQSYELIQKICFQKSERSILYTTHEIPESATDTVLVLNNKTIAKTIARSSLQPHYLISIPTPFYSQFLHSYKLNKATSAISTLEVPEYHYKACLDQLYLHAITPLEIQSYLPWNL